MPNQNPQIEILERLNDLTRRTRVLESQESPSLATGLTGILPSTRGGTGINNGGRTLTIATNSGTLAFSAASSTLTIPATGTAALLGTANVFTANQAINGNLTVDTNVLFVDATSNRVGIGTASPTNRLHIVDLTVNSQGVAFALNGLPTTPHAFIGATNSSKTLWITAGAENTGNLAALDGMTARNIDAAGAGTAAGIRLGGSSAASAGDISFFTAAGLTNGNTFTWFGPSGATGEVVRIRQNGNVLIGTATDNAQLSVSQSSTTAAEPVLRLRQADVSEEFIRFETTVGAGNAINTTALGAYYGRARVWVEGVGEKWLALYDA
jgi:hypothetical protein